MVTVDNLLENLIDPVTIMIKSCWIDGQVFLIFVRISMISLLF